MIDLSISTFLLTIINVGVLFFVLRAVLFKRVTKFMSDRTAKIQHDLENAEKTREEAKALLRQYEEKLKNVQVDADAIISKAKKQAQKEAERIISDGRETADMLIEQAHKQIEKDHETAITVFRAEAAALVVNASSKLLQRELSQEDNMHFAGILLKEIRKK